MKLALMVGAPDMAEQGGYVETPVGSFAETFARARQIGFDGAEVLYGERLTGDVYRLREAVRTTQVQVAGFNSGRLFFDHGLQLLCGSSRHCALTQASIYDLIRLSGAFSTNINIGMFRGMPASEDQAPALTSLVSKLQQLADYAAHLDVRLLLEPANKQEFPFIASTQEGIEIVRRVGRPNVNLMLDTFHMAVEKEDICDSLEMAMPHLYHIHFLDLDRNPPGRDSVGVDMEAVVECLVRNQYRHYLSMPLVKGQPDAGTREIVMDIKKAITAAETYRIGGMTR